MTKATKIDTTVLKQSAPGCTREDLAAAVHAIQEIFKDAPVIPTGSTHLYGEGADCDVVLYDAYGGGERLLALHGYLDCAEYPEDAAKYRALRSGNVNAIVVTCPALFDAWREATALAVKLVQAGVQLDKVQRAVLFNAVKEAY